MTVHQKWQSLHETKYRRCQQQKNLLGERNRVAKPNVSVGGE
jgi:hypothetical protein